MNQPTNGHENQPADMLADLAVPAEQAQQTTGGQLNPNGHGTHVAGTIGSYAY